MTIYIYIYIYCHPQTDCFVVSQLPQCGLTRETLPAEIEIQLTLRQLDNITSQQAADPTQAREFNAYVLTSFLFYILR